MQLKTYQQNALDQLDRWLDALKEARLKREKASKALEESGLDVPDASERGQMKIGKLPAPFRLMFEVEMAGTGECTVERALSERGAPGLLMGHIPARTRAMMGQMSWILLVGGSLLVVACTGASTPRNATKPGPPFVPGHYAVSLGAGATYIGEDERPDPNAAAE